MMRWHCGVAALALAWPIGALAQDDEPEPPIILYHPRVETIVVVAGGNLTPLRSDGVQMVTTIRDIDDGPGGRLENRLRDEAGLAQFRRSDARSAHPTSQGVTLRGLGGNASSRALVTLDGVPQADPFGGWVAWSAYDAIRLGGARIMRGGGSGVDGPGALAGTVALFSDMAAGANLSASAGSHGMIDGAVSLGGDVGRGAVALDVRFARGDGFRPVIASQRGAADRAAPWRQYGAGMRARFDAGDNGRVELALRSFSDHRDRGVDFSASQVEGLDASIRFVRDTTPYAGWQVMALGYAQLRDLDTGFASVAADRSSAAPVLAQRVPALGLGARVEVRPPLARGNPLRLGADWRGVRGETQEQFAFTGQTPTRFRIARGASDTLGLFADGWADAGDVRFTLSGRIDHWRIAPALRTERLIGGAPLSDARFAAWSGWAGTGRAGLRWEDGDLTLRSAAYTGWRLPTLNELYRPFRAGADATAANENLRPERLWGGEAGAAWQLGDLDLSATAYWNRLHHAIANVTLARGPGNFPGVGFVGAAGRFAQRQNLDKIAARGAEAQARLRLGDVDLRATYAFTDARVRASGAAAALDGQRPAQVARHSASLLADADLDRVRLGATLRYIGPQNEDDLGQQRLRGAVTLDARASWDVRDNLTLDLRAENLANALVPAAISSGGVIERTSPRSLWLGRAPQV